MTWVVRLFRWKGGWIMATFSRATLISHIWIHTITTVHWSCGERSYLHLIYQLKVGPHETKPKPNFGGKKVKKVSVGSGLVLITPDFSEKTGAYFSVGGNVGMAFFPGRGNLFWWLSLSLSWFIQTFEEFKRALGWNTMVQIGESFSE